MKNDMNSLILQIKKVTLLRLTTFALGCAALLPGAQAVSPAPDGGYAGGNTAEGQNALLSLTTGIYNTGVGIFSLLSLTDGQFCTGIGAGTLLVNTADGNTATGVAALFSNTVGGGNVANGAFALFSNGTANDNTAVGDNALLNNDKTVAALGNVNTAVGAGALQNNVDGDSNTAVGAFALFGENATGGFPNGVSNNAVGRQALTSDTTGSFNAAMGVNALQQNTTGNGNIAIGDDTMFHNVDASFNTAVGDSALINNAHGAENTVVGFGTGQNLVNPGSDGNIYIGAGAGGPGDEVAFIRIGTPIFEGFPYDTYIAGIFDRDVDASTAVAVFADANQKVGTNLVDANGNKIPFKPQAMLDESLKQQKKIAELEVTVERQQKGMEVLTARLNEQATQIQKVSARLELIKPTPQEVANQ